MDEPEFKFHFSDDELTVFLNDETRLLRSEERIEAARRDEYALMKVNEALEILGYERLGEQNERTELELLEHKFRQFEFYTKRKERDDSHDALDSHDLAILFEEAAKAELDNLRIEEDGWIEAIAEKLALLTLQSQDGSLSYSDVQKEKMDFLAHMLAVSGYTNYNDLVVTANTILPGQLINLESDGMRNKIDARRQEYKTEAEKNELRVLVGQALLTELELPPAKFDEDEPATISDRVLSILDQVFDMIFITPPPQNGYKDRTRVVVALGAEYNLSDALIERMLVFLDTRLAF